MMESNLVCKSKIFFKLKKTRAVSNSSVHARVNLDLFSDEPEEDVHGTAVDQSSKFSNSDTGIKVNQSAFEDHKSRGCDLADSGDFSVRRLLSKSTLAFTW